MIMTAFLQDAFRQFSGNFAVWQEQASADQPDHDQLTEAVERVVDETSRRLRVLPGYRRRLEGPVAETFLYIDNLVERMPGSFMCSRAAFSVDPRVKTFFVNPGHLQEVFSQSREVRELFDANPQAEECCALVCMRMEERQKFGVALVGDSVHREVMQTTVSFQQHQLYSPGVSETDARRALKCCIFRSLLSHIRQQLVVARASDVERRKQLSELQRRLREAQRQETTDESLEDLRLQIKARERASLNPSQMPQTLEEQLEFVADVLGKPDQFVSGGFQRLRLSHLGVRVPRDSTEPACELDIAEIRIANREPRVAALVRFPRAELLPKPGFLLQTGALFPA
jgi:hypothetical protein